MINGNDPAMPVQIDNDVDVHNYGFTKREYFAGLAMQGILANPAFYELISSKLPAIEMCDFYSEVAIEQADSLIAALNAQE